MKRLIPLAAMALIASLTAAHAQSATATGTGQAASQAQSGSSSGANSTITNTDNRVSNNVNPDDVDVRGVPDVYAPSVQHSAPCYVAVNAGMSIMGFGGALGSGLFDESCDQRNNVAMLINAGMPDVASAYWCNMNEDIAKAMADAGKACGVPMDPTGGGEAKVLRDHRDDNDPIGMEPIYGPGDPVRVGALAKFRD